MLYDLIGNPLIQWFNLILKNRDKKDKNVKNGSRLDIGRIIRVMRVIERINIQSS
jgi:hypothetical protein